MSAWKWGVSLSAGAILLGVLTLACVSPGVIIPGGDPAAGQTTFAALCSTCHAANSLRGRESLIVNNMGTVSSAMAGITLTDQQIADLQAFIATQ